MTTPVLLLALMVFTVAAQAEEGDAPLSFGAMGDGPRESSEWPEFARQIAAESDDPRSMFLVHLGDICKGTKALPEWHYIGVAALLKTSRKPVYVVIGDNEWNDLEDPAIGWDYWLKHFGRFYRHFDNAPATVTQPEQTGNFAFVKNRVLVIGLTLVGGTVHDEEEWKRRDADNLAWVNECLDRFGPGVQAAVVCAQAAPSNRKHGGFTAQFVKSVEAFEKPVLYVHGDGHVYRLDLAWRAPNLTKVQVDRGATNPPLLITVTANSDKPFTFDRRIEP